MLGLPEPPKDEETPEEEKSKDEKTPTPKAPRRTIMYTKTGQLIAKVAILTGVVGLSVIALALTRALSGDTDVFADLDD